MQEILLALDEFGYETSAATAQLAPADAALRKVLAPGDFIWSDVLAAVYPSETFWWLYGLPDAP